MTRGVLKASLVLLAGLTGALDGRGPPGGPAATAAGEEAPAGLRLLELDGRPADPLSEPGEDLQVFLFVRTDCPVSNRYAPEMQRIQGKYAARGVTFFVIYPDPDESPEAIRTHLREYGFPGTPLRDPLHDLVQRTGATVTPEVAVFTGRREMIYRGRIDNRFPDYGKTRARATRHDLRDILDAALSGEADDFSATRAVGCFIPALE